MSLASLLARYGYLAILVGTFLEGETILVLGGFAAHRGYLRLEGVLAAAFAGSLLGDQLYFLLGRWRGAAFLARRPHWQGRVGRVRALVHRHQKALILGFRFVYGIRTITPFVLGTSGISGLRFLWMNALGAAAWALAIGLAGYTMGSAIERVLGDVRRYERWTFLAIGLVGALAWSLYWLRLRRSAGSVTE